MYLIIVAITAQTSGDIVFQFTEAIADSVVIHLQSGFALTAVYDPLSSLYTVHVPPLPEGSYLLTINATNTAGSTLFYTDLHSMVPISGFTVSTPYGAPSQGDPLTVADLTFEQAITLGFSMSLGVAAGSNVSVIIGWGDGDGTNYTLPTLNVAHVYGTGGSYAISVTATSLLG